MIHAYHYLLMLFMIRLKKKGDYHLKLINADRLEMVRHEGLKITEPYIHQVLSESGKHNQRFTAYILNQLAMYIGYTCWNDFLKHNPLPYVAEPMLFYALPLKRQKFILKAVELRMSNTLKDGQKQCTIPVSVEIITTYPAATDLKREMHYILEEKTGGKQNEAIERKNFETTLHAPTLLNFNLNPLKNYKLIVQAYGGLQQHINRYTLIIHPSVKTNYLLRVMLTKKEDL